MSLIEVNNIENYGNSNGWDWKSLLAVLFGYLLKLATDEFSKTKDKKKVGEIFEYELKSFKNPLQKQLEDIITYTSKTAKYEDTTISIYFKHKFDLIKTLDKVTLVKFYKKTYKNEAASYVSKAFNNIDLLYTELIRYEEFYKAHSKEIDSFLLDYKTNLDSTRRTVAMYCDKLTKEQYSNDILLNKFAEINAKYLGNISLDLKYIISLQETFHLTLFKELPIVAQHPLYNTLNEFNFKGRDYIQLFKSKTERQVSYLKTVESSIKEKYFGLYNEELKVN